MHSVDILLCAVKSVASIVLVALAGYFLVRKKYLDRNSMQSLSRIVFTASLPCLLFTQAAKNIDLKVLRELYFMPIACVVYVFLGAGLWWIFAKLAGPSPENRHIGMAASSFGNSGYLPIPLIAAITVIFPVFSSNPASPGLGITYISAFLLAYSPMLWTVGYRMMAGKKPPALKFTNIITPPIIGLFCGATVGLLPFLNTLLCSSDSILFPIYSAANTLGLAAIPFSLIVLGGGFAETISTKTGAHIDSKTVIGVSTVKLILLPLIAFGLIVLSRNSGLIPREPLLAAVLLILAASPSATNLSVISSLHGEKESELAHLLLIIYCISLVTLTFFIVIGARFLFGGN